MTTINNPFGGREFKDTNPSMYERALADMQNKEVVLVGDGKNTYQANGKYYAMGREVTEKEYNDFYDRFLALKELELAQKRAALN